MRKIGYIITFVALVFFAGFAGHAELHQEDFAAYFWKLIVALLCAVIGYLIVRLEERYEDTERR